MESAILVLIHSPSEEEYEMSYVIPDQDWF